MNNSININKKKLIFLYIFNKNIKMDNTTIPQVDYHDLLALILTYKTKNYCLIDRLLKIISHPMINGTHILVYAAKTENIELFKLGYKYYKQDLSIYMSDIIKYMSSSLAYYILDDNIIDINFLVNDKTVIQHIFENAIWRGDTILYDKILLNYKNINITLEYIFGVMNLEITEKLLKKGADPNIKIDDKYLIEYVYDLFISRKLPDPVQCSGSAEYYFNRLLKFVRSLIQYPIIITDDFYIQICGDYKKNGYRHDVEKREMIEYIFEIICKNAENKFAS